MAVVLSDRFEGFGDPSGLDAALAAADRARIQNLLSVLLLDRYQLDGEPERLDEAVTWARAAVATTDGNDPELAGYFTNLGGARRLAFEATLAAVDWSAPEDVELDVTDLRNAIAAHRRATVLSPVGSTDHPKHMSNLGAVLIDAAVLLPDEFDLGEAVAVLREAVAVTSPGSPVAADLLHRIQLTRDDQATWLRAADGLAAAGAHALARLGAPVPAVVMAEGGRARLLSDALGADRMLLARLSNARPQLADRFAAVTAAHRSRQQRFDPPR